MNNLYHVYTSKVATDVPAAQPFNFVTQFRTILEFVSLL